MQFFFGSIDQRCVVDGGCYFAAPYARLFHYYSAFAIFAMLCLLRRFRQQYYYNKIHSSDTGTFKSKKNDRSLFLVLLVVAAASTTVNYKTQVQYSHNVGVLPVPVGRLSLSSSPLLQIFLVTTAKGDVITLDAETGNVMDVFYSGAPLIEVSNSNMTLSSFTTSSPSPPPPSSFKISAMNSNKNKDSRLIFAPGLDGILFSRRSDSNTWNAITYIPNLVQDPIHFCQPLQNNNNKQEVLRGCGIISSIVVGQFYAIDSRGKILWISSSVSKVQSSTTAATEEEKKRQLNETPLFLLKRDNYNTQQISTITGKEEWNVKWGTWNALDFLGKKEGRDEKSSSNYKNRNQQNYRKFLLRTTTKHKMHDDFTMIQNPHRKKMPLVKFANKGYKKVIAIDELTGNILWRRDFTSVVSSSVFAINQGTWQQIEMPSKHSSFLKKYNVSSTTRKQSKKKDTFQHFHSASFNLKNKKRLAVLKNMLEDSTLYGNKTKGISKNNDNSSQRSPSLASSINTGAAHLKHDVEKGGVFLSWYLVLATTVGIITTAFGAGIFFMIKKEKWQESSEKKDLTVDDEKEENETLEATTNSKELGSEQIRPLGSTKLENDDTSVVSIRLCHQDSFIDIKQTERYSGSNQFKRKRKIATPISRVTTNDNFNANSNETSLSMPSTQEQRSVLIDEIPLIYYSRYLSEFQELEHLDKGRFGTVYRCSNVLDGREYAMKKVLIRSDINSSAGNGTDNFSQELHRFLQEVKIQALLDHPNIVRYYTSWIEVEETNILSEDSNTCASVDNSSHSSCDCFSETTRRLNSKQDSRNVSKYLRPYKTSNLIGCANFTEYESLLSRVRKSPLPATDDSGPPFDKSNDRHVSDEIVCDDLAELSLQSESATDTDTNGFSDNSTISKRISFKPSKRSSKYTLYIQMQLCTAKTLVDFLADKEGRKGNYSDAAENGVDIPIALNLFRQVALAVNHIHAQGLIHRDLKPANCFIYDSYHSGTVKVGNFDLSRESGNTLNPNNTHIVVSSTKSNAYLDMHYYGVDVNNTFGVGTRSYASPEQMNGSGYDSSADIYSLGIMLFELCYPMYTDMERNIVLDQLRNKRTFPKQWQSSLSTFYPSLHKLVSSMISFQPSDRPSAQTIVQIIDSLVEDHTLLSINDSDHSNDNIIYVKVKSRSRDDILQHTIKIIQDAAIAATVSVDILRYGLKSSSNDAGSNNNDRTSIMEFALLLNFSNESYDKQSIETYIKDMIASIKNKPEVVFVRQYFTRSKK